MTLADTLSAAASSLANAVAGAFGQAARQLRIEFGGSAASLNASLSVARFSGWEAISEGSEFTIELLSGDAHIELKSLMLAPATLTLASDVTAAGDRRFSGLVSKAEQLGSNNGLSLYRITLSSSLYLLTKRRNNRSFGERSVPDVLDLLLTEHQAINPLLKWQVKLSDKYPARAYLRQYRESDFAFLDRLLRREGIFWYVDHSGSEAGEHTLIFCDQNEALQAHAASPVQFHRADVTEQHNSVTHWHAQRRLVPGQVSLTSRDFKLGTSQSTECGTNHDHGNAANGAVPALEDYVDGGLRYGVDSDDLSRYAMLRMQAYEARAKHFDGVSTVPEMTAGTWFELTDHAIHDADGQEDRQFLLLRVEHQGRNNLESVFGAGQHTLLRDGQEDDTRTYENRVIAIRRGVPYRPAFDDIDNAPPQAAGPQVAIVVGPEGSEVHTDDWGRIKVRFPHQRAQDHRAGETGSVADASGDDSCWVRVAQSIAGSSYGARFTPRVGQEVVVDFLDGNIERPIVRQVLNDANNKEARFSRMGNMPTEKTLSGIKSKEHAGDAYSELVFDDTTAQVRARIASSPGHSELNLGYLTEPRQDGKAKARGEGLELRTDDSLALRSARGLLISAWSRLNATGGQLDRAEHLALMEDCVALFKALGQAAVDAQALPSDTAPAEKLKAGLDRWEDGSNTKPDAPSDEGARRPIIGITGPDAINLATPKEILSYAGSNHDTIAQQHVQVTAGQHLAMNAGKGASLFAASEGIKIIANQGDVLVQSQHGATTINADKDVTITSNGRVRIMAQGIDLIANDGSFVSIGGGVKIGTNGNIEQHAAAFPLSGPSTMSACLPQFAKGPSDQKFVLKYHGYDQGGLPAANRDYKITMSDGSVVKGTTDASGKTSLLQKDAAHIADINWLTKKVS